MRKGQPPPGPAVINGKEVSLIHLENRIKRVRLLAEQATLTEEARRLKSTQHAIAKDASRREKVDSRPLSRPTRPVTEVGRKKEGGERRDRSTSAKPNIQQPSTSKEPVRSEVVRKDERKTAERRPTAKSREMNRDRSKDKSPYDKRSAASPASSTESIQRLMDEVKRLRDENEKLRGKVEVDLTNSKDLQEWPRKDLLKLIVQLESKEVRKPVQAAVKKLTEMGDTMTLHDQLKLARDTVESLKQQNANLQDQLTEAKSTPSPPIRQIPDVPRLDMDWLHNSLDSPEINGTDDANEELYEEKKGQNGQNGHPEVIINEPEPEPEKSPVITDPALMPRYEYDQIACDIVHATRAAILRKRFMERWKKEREDVEERLPRK